MASSSRHFTRLWSALGYGIPTPYQQLIVYAAGITVESTGPKCSPLRNKLVSVIKPARVGASHVQ